MLFRQKTGTFIRTFGEIGYIVNREIYKEQIVNSAGAVFISVLARTSKSLETLTGEIASVFSGVEPDTLRKDVLVFYSRLEQDGLIVSGESEAELDKKDIRFSYERGFPSDVFNKTRFFPKDTTEYLLENCKDNPHLFGMQIEITSRCNERCIHCYIPHGNSPCVDIDDELFYSILDQCHDMGVIDMTLSGGECMLHPHFIDFFKKATEYDFSVVLLSNLTHLSDDILAELEKNPNLHVQVSLYSMNPAVHDEITQVPGSFNKTYDSILKLVEKNIPVRINCPVMKQNKSDYRDVLVWAQNRLIPVEADYNIMARYDQSTDNTVHRLTLGEIENVLNDIILKDTQYQRRLSEDNTDFTGKNEIGNDRFCGACITAVNIAENGNVCPCAAWQGYIIGNIKEQRLSDLWNNSPNIKVIRDLRRKDIPQCLDCGVKSFCSVCLARNFNETPLRNMLKVPEYMCKEAELNRKTVLGWKAGGNRT